MTVIAFTSRSVKTMSDGTLRLSVDVQPGEDAQAAFAMFGMPGVAGAICRLTDETAQEQLQQKTIGAEEKPYGEQARILKLSAFFRTPDVWRAIGSDQEFLDWIKLQRCAVKDKTGCGGDVVPAHVRRIANGAGVGVKPPYSAIPLCDNHHSRQHQYGESALGGPEWFDKKRIEYVQQWAWETLKTLLGHESWGQVPPSLLIAWALSNEVKQYLPGGYT